MKKSKILAAVAIVAFAACAKTNDSYKGITLTGEFSDEFTKTQLASNGITPLWSAGDKVDINGTVFTVASAYDGQASASFEGVEDLGLFIAYYPASVANGQLPATQTYSANKIVNAPMYAFSLENNLQFVNLCSVLCLNLTTEKSDICVSKISVSADQGLSGNFEVVDDNKAVVSGTSGVALDCSAQDGGGVTINGTAKSFYIVIPEGDYTNFAITVRTKDGKNQTRKAATFSAKRNRFENLSLSFNNFAQGAPDGFVDLGLSVYWAEKNLGARTVATDYYTCIGDFYMWGETFTRLNMAGISESALFASNKYWIPAAGRSAAKGYGPNGYSLCSGPDANYTKTKSFYKYNEIDNLMRLELVDDAANKALGKGYRIPTKAEFQELLDNCDVEFCDGTTTKYNGSSVIGAKFTSKKNGAILFIPHPGYVSDDWEYYFDMPANNHNMYWTADLLDLSYYDDPTAWTKTVGDYRHTCVWVFSIPADGEYKIHYNERFYGLAIRPIMEKSLAQDATEGSGTVDWKEGSDHSGDSFDNN